MSGALPCTASKTPISVPRFAAGHDAEPAHQAGTEIRHDVAVQVRQQQHVELLGFITSCMQAASTMRSS